MLNYRRGGHAFSGYGQLDSARVPLGRPHGGSPS
jgi:hypothetical protein